MDAIPPLLQRVFRAWADRSYVRVSGVQQRGGVAVALLYYSDRKYVRLRAADGSEFDVPIDAETLDFGDGD